MLLYIARSPPKIGLPDFLQQNTGDFCLSVTFVKDNIAISCVCVCLFRSIVTMGISVAVCEIFSSKEWYDLENRVRVRSRSLEMAPFVRSHTSSYSLFIVTLGAILYRLRDIATCW